MMSDTIEIELRHLITDSIKHIQQTKREYQMIDDDIETFTIMVSQNKNKKELVGTWTTEQLVKALLEKGGLLSVSSILTHPSSKAK